MQVVRAGLGGYPVHVFCQDARATDKSVFHHSLLLRFADPYVSSNLVSVKSASSFGERARRVGRGDVRRAGVGGVTAAR